MFNLFNYNKVFFALVGILIIIGSCKNETNQENKFIIRKKPIDNPFVIDKNKKRQLITFTHIKDIGLKSEMSKTGHPYLNQFIQNDTGIFMITHYKHDSLLYIHNLKNQTEIKTIPVKKTSLLSMLYLNKDSILLMYDAHSTLGYNHDSSFVMINETGKVLKYFKYDEANVSSTKNGFYFGEEYDKIKDSICYTQIFFKILPFENQKVFFSIFPFKSPPNYIGGEDFFKIDLPFTGYEDLRKSKFTGFNKIKYPNLTKKTYYPQNYNRPLFELLHDNKNVLISYSYTPTIQKYNYKTGEISTINSLDSYFIDTIHATKTKPINRSNYKRFSYSEIINDKKNNRFFRILVFPSKYNKFSIILSDSNFNVIGEGIAPDGCGDRNFIALSKDTVLFFNYNKTIRSKDSMFLSVYKMEFGNGIEDLTKKLRREYEVELLKNSNLKITDYLKSIATIKDKTYSAIIMPTGMACQGCVEATTDFYSVYYSNKTDAPCYLIVSDANKGHAENLLKKYNLKLDFKNIYYDNNNNYIKYHPDNTITNPRLVLVENGKIIKDKIYSAKEILELQKDNAEFMKKHGFIKGYEKK